MGIQRKVKLEIGDIVFSVEAADEKRGIALDSAHRKFISKKSPDIKLKTFSRGVPAINAVKTVFDSKSFWKIYEDEKNYLICLYENKPPYNEYKRAVMSKDYLSGEIYAKAGAEEDYPLNYPVEELILINMLHRRQGVTLHSCGVGNENEGYMFVGVSGAGKSTISKVLESDKNLRIMSDDRVIIRENEGMFWIYGTPWHGDVDICVNLKAPLKKIFFIKHSEENFANRWDSVKAAANLIARAFPPYWDEEGMDKTADLCVKVALNIPCYELGFVPDKAIIQFIKDIDG